MIRFNRRDNDGDHGSWPGFVDALATVLLVFIFVLVGFIASQMYLSQVIFEKENDLSSLENELTNANAFIANASDKNIYLEKQVSSLKKTIARLNSILTDEKNKQKTIEDSNNNLKTQNTTLSQSLDILNNKVAQLNDELQQIRQALSSAKNTNEEHVKTIEYMKDENLKLSELKKLHEYRSDFFAKLCDILKDNPNIKIVGDRFMFQSELLFDSASDRLTENGIKQIVGIAEVVKTIANKIPKDVPWILCVHGHTDTRPISNAQFKSNWHLAFARAIAVVNLLTQNGVPSNRLVAVSFGPSQPVATGNTPESHAQNRRIEFKIDSVPQLHMPQQDKKPQIQQEA